MCRQDKQIILMFACFFLMNFASAQRSLEKLDRGLVAIKTSGGVFISWRVFGTDPDDIAFNLYRDGTKVNAAPITGATNLTDAAGATGSAYTIQPILNGIEKPVGGQADVWASQTKEIPLQQPAPGVTPSYSVTNKSVLESYPNGQSYTYSPNDINVGDVDGDGQYELVVKWDPSNARDNSFGGITGPVFLDAYELDGTLLWRISLGKNIRAGAHYTQHLVADFDLDGKAEVICKTAPGTKDGRGNFLHTGPAANDNDNADHRTTGNWPGFIIEGPEYLTIFNGETGAEMQTVQFLVGRGDTDSWGKTGDNTNRLDRFNSTVAYLDGKTPSAVFNRGYYGRMTHSAWDWNGTSLTSRWVFNSDNPYCGDAAGNGHHSLMAADIDNDGFDEILTGAACIDHDGTLKWSTNLGHGDANHLGDLDPSNDGLELYIVLEGDKSEALIDTKTGNVLWKNAASKDNARGMAADIDATHPGYEMWSSHVGGVKTNKNVQFSTNKPSNNFRIYWDGDLLDELLDGSTITKWNGSGSDNLYGLQGGSCNGTKSTPNLSADILGDWREEVILHDGASKLYLQTTTIPTQHKLYTLMHDPVYRNAVSRQQSAYNQPPHVGFYLGNGADNAPKPNIELVGAIQIDCNGVENGTAYFDACNTCVEGNTGLKPCVLDCNGDVDGSAYLDDCNTCVGGNTGLDECSAILAEDACDFLGLVESDHDGYTGTGYINTPNEKDAYVTLAAWAVADTKTTMVVRYANGGDANRPFALFCNGTQKVASVAMDASGGWNVWTTLRIDFDVTAGINSINLMATTDLGLANIDQIWFSTNGVEPTDCQGTGPGKSINLKEGWNLIAYPLEDAAATESALQSIWDHVEVIKNMDGFYAPGYPAYLNSLTQLSWGMGFFIKVDADCTLVWE